MCRQIFRQIVLKRRRNTSVFQGALVRYGGKSASRLRTKPTGVPCAVLPYDFCTLLLNCLNCVLFVILWCLLLFCLILFWFLKLCDVFIIPLYCVPESRSHFFTAVLFELRYLFYVLHNLIKIGVMLLIQSLFAEGG